LMLGIGLDFHIAGRLGFVLEADTTFRHDLSWGGDGMPLEVRAGLSFAL
jgi:hypothetical protein